MTHRCYDGKVVTIVNGAGTGCEGGRSAPSFGRLTSIHNSAATTSLGYNSAGRIVSSSQKYAGQAFSYAFVYSYNADGSLATQQYPSGHVVSYFYDAAGRPAAVARGNRHYGSAFSYTPHGAIKSYRYGAGTSAAGLWEHRAYNSRLQLAGLAVGTQFKSGFASQHSVEFDAQNPFVASHNDRLGIQLSYPAEANNGNLQAQTVRPAAAGSVLVQNYTYDTSNRLLAAAESGSGWSQTYVYDAYGNMKYSGGQEFPGLSPLEFDPATNRISSPSGADGDGYSYDAAGNLTKGPGLREYSYDAEGRITEVKLSGSVIASYQYNGEGRRVREVKGSAVTYFVYDASGQKAAEYSTLAPEGTGTRYLTADHLGSIRLITDEALAARHCYDYKPFGEVFPVAGSVRQTVSCYGAGGNSAREKFTGKERDGETGLDYFGARYLSGAQGRFTSPDTPGADWSLDDAQSWNLYSYVRNNPPRFIDPLGRKCVTLDGGGTGDDGAGESCNDKGLKTSHGATVNGTSGRLTTSFMGTR